MIMVDHAWYELIVEGWQCREVSVVVIWHQFQPGMLPDGTALTRTAEAAFHTAVCYS